MVLYKLPAEDGVPVVHSEHDMDGPLGIVDAQKRHDEAAFVVG